MSADRAMGARGRLAGAWLDRFGVKLRYRFLIAVLGPLFVFTTGSSLARADLHTLCHIAVWALVATSLNLVMGYAGQINLATGAFFALGAYVGVLGTGRWNWPGLQTTLVALASAGVLAALLGLVIFRSRGLHFALLTAGVSLVTYNVLVSWTSVTGGIAGISTSGPIQEGGIPRPLRLGPLVIEDDFDYIRLFVVVLAALMLATSVIARRRSGLSWQATGDDEVLAAAVGVNVLASKQASFVASSVLTALVGVLFGHWGGYITPSSFSFAAAAFLPLAMVIIGGAGSIVGPSIGALVVIGMPTVFDGLEKYAVLVYGLFLLFVVMACPSGVVGLARSAPAILRDLLSRRRLTTPALERRPSGA